MSAWRPLSRSTQVFDHLIHSSAGQKEPSLCGVPGNSENRRRFRNAVSLDVAEKKYLSTTPT
jgi:hypothetical protein